MSKRRKPETTVEKIHRLADEIRASTPPGQSKALGDRIIDGMFASQTRDLLSGHLEKARREAERDETQRATLRALQTLVAQSEAANGQRKPRSAGEPTRSVGAPDKCSPYVEEFRRRVRDGAVLEETGKRQAERLHAWGKQEFPRAEVPAVESIRKAIGRDFRDAKERAERK